MHYIFNKKPHRPIILFLHGWCGDKYSFINTYNFLSSYDFSVLSVDFSGFGQNPPLEKDYTIFDYALDLKSLLNSLEIDEFYVVCHSFGARVLAIINEWFNIKKIVITAGAGIKQKYSFCKNYKIFKYKIIKFLVKIKILKKQSLSKFGSDDYKNLPLYMKKTFVNIVNQNLDNYFKKINAKVMLFWGKDDNITPLYMAKKMNKLIKNSTLFIENGGHFAYLENDFSFNNKVLEFFKGD